MTLPADLSSLSDEELKKLEADAQERLKTSWSEEEIQPPRVLDPVAGAAGAAFGWNQVASQLTGPGQTIREAYNTSPQIFKGTFGQRLPEFYTERNPVVRSANKTLRYMSDAIGSKGPYMEKVNELGNKITALEPQRFYDKSGQPHFRGSESAWHKLQQEAYRLRVPYSELARTETATPWAPYKGAETLKEFKGKPSPTKSFDPLNVVRPPNQFEKVVDKGVQVASKVPGLKQGLSYLDKQGTKALQSPWTRRVAGGLGGLGAGVTAYDALERGRKGDYIGAGLSGASSLAYLASLSPHPIPKAVGFLGGLAIDQALLPAYDKYQQYKKNPQQAGPFEVDYSTQPIS